MLLFAGSRVNCRHAAGLTFSFSIIASSAHQDLFYGNSFIMADFVINPGRLVQLKALLFHIPRFISPDTCLCLTFGQQKCVFLFVGGHSATEDSKLLAQGFNISVNTRDVVLKLNTKYKLKKNLSKLCWFILVQYISVHVM